ncbi:MAG TPA: sulfate adenylyltransferase subunit CysD, partial [Chthoniobacteraceae bacterium]|nr:sulfate adenylyltransferase subunit CysD [Chthoniobacteraceae bacterium]
VFASSLLFMDHSQHPAYSKLYPAPHAEEPPAFFPTKFSRDDAAHLDALEAQSIFIIREAYHHFKNICMPWSMGKDSNVLIWLSKKAFAGHIPYPLLHIDTTYEFPEMLEYRDWAVKQYGLNLIVKINEDARAGVGEYAKTGPIGYDTTDPVTVTHELKTAALQQVMAQYKWDALITGIRRDEDPTRAKERYFSPRNKDFEWDYKDQPPEFWNQFTTSCAPGEHVRVQALLDWSERDIWMYIQREGIPIPKMYFARSAPDGRRYRFRSLGCWPISGPVESEADDIPKIIDELASTKTSERAGRAQDHHERNAMQKLRAKGFM